MSKKFGEQAMQALEQLQESVELFTGAKNQFISAGWSEAIAEQMVLQIFTSANQMAGKVEK